MQGGHRKESAEVNVERWRERFHRWADAKTATAVAAALPPYVTELERPGSDAVGIGNEWTMRGFGGLFYLSAAADARRPACSLVFVQSADGNTGADDPAALGGGATDKHLIYEGLARVAAHAVLAGARTVRGADLIFSVWHPELVRLRASLGFPRHPAQVVVTTRGLDLETALFANVPEIQVILLASPQAIDAMYGALAPRPWITPLTIGEGGDLHGPVAQLRAMGIERVSCVGGRTLAASLLDAGAIDEVYLTTASRPGGEPGTPLHRSAWRGPTLLRKRGTGPEAGVIFEQIVPARPTA